MEILELPRTGAAPQLRRLFGGGAYSSKYGSVYDIIFLFIALITKTTQDVVSTCGLITIRTWASLMEARAK